MYSTVLVFFAQIDRHTDRRDQKQYLLCRAQMRNIAYFFTCEGTVVAKRPTVIPKL